MRGDASPPIHPISRTNFINKKSHFNSMVANIILHTVSEGVFYLQLTTWTTNAAQTSHHLVRVSKKLTVFGTTGFETLFIWLLFKEITHRVARDTYKKNTLFYCCVIYIGDTKFYYIFCIGKITFKLNFCIEYVANTITSRNVVIFK